VTRGELLDQLTIERHTPIPAHRIPEPATHRAPMSPTAEYLLALQERAMRGETAEDGQARLAELNAEIAYAPIARALDNR
jgi:hypothetical protein